MRLRSAFLWSMIISLALAALLGIIAIVFDDFGWRETELILTALLAGAFCLFALGYAVVIDKHRVVPLMWSGMCSATAAAVIWLLMIWMDPYRWDDSFFWEKIFAQSGITTTIIAIWSVHLGLLLLAPLRQHTWRRVRLATLLFSSALAVLIISLILIENIGTYDPLAEGMFVLTILIACGTIIIPVVATIEQIRQRDEPGAITPRRIALTLTCPRCQSVQSIETGHSKCSACGLRITVDIEEPRCACGYLLYQLKGKACPECGREIDTPDHWTANK